MGDAVWGRSSVLPSCQSRKLINASGQTCFMYLVSSEVRTNSNIRIFWLKIILPRNERALDFKNPGRDEDNVMLTDDWLGCRFVFNTDMIMERQQEDKWAYFQNCDTLPLKLNSDEWIWWTQTKMNHNSPKTFISRLTAPLWSTT